MALILESLASQAAITIQNVRYIKEIQELFQSFVRVMSSAIDQRTPYNANHSRRMAECCGRFVDFLNAQAEEAGQEPPFSAQHREELVMSVWLHDVGKVVTPLEVMDKAKRLSPLQEARLQNRILDVWLTKRIDCLEGRITQEELEAVRRETGEAAEHIARINGAGFLPDEELAWLEELRGRTYTDRGQERPWITDEEYAMLSIRKGTLSPEERKIMEDHVVVTDTLLSQIHFSKELSHVREWAAAHHELLDGSGYPGRRKGEDIPQEVRIITILDIFDALVADDRPYKPGMPVPRALSILETMADKEGKLDPALTRLFVQSRCWEAGEAGFANPQ
jgi:HD-GYP domain-containing protein (c-di-GMP phosphodiesterase class II)